MTWTYRWLYPARSGRSHAGNSSTTGANFLARRIWELRGDVADVVFSNANPVVGDTVYVYYGGADHVVGSATCKLADLVQYPCLDRLPARRSSTPLKNISAS